MTAENSVVYRGLANLLTAQEEERRRVSRELHDELGQRLALLEIQIHDMEQRLGLEAPAAAEFETLRARVGSIADDVHRICCRLHPAILENLGLVVALRSYCEEYSKWSGVKTRFTHCGVPASLPSSVSLCVYRLTQEALRNVAKHAQADRAVVIVNADKDELNVTIKDSGIGFIPAEVQAKGGLGLVSVCERVRLAGGTCSIRSAPLRGTSIRAWIPLLAQAAVE